MTLKNTNENAIIKVSSKQTSNGDSEEMEFVTRGCFCQRGRKFYIFYAESEEMGMANCTVMLIAEEKTVTMRRRGEFELKMTYIEGESESVIYYLPFGEINMTQTTHSVFCSLDDNGGEIKVNYTLLMDGAMQENELTIKVERQIQ